MQKFAFSQISPDIRWRREQLFNVVLAWITVALNWILFSGFIIPTETWDFHLSRRILPAPWWRRTLRRLFQSTIGFPRKIKGKMRLLLLFLCPPGCSVSGGLNVETEIPGCKTIQGFILGHRLLSQGKCGLFLTLVFSLTNNIYIWCVGDSVLISLGQDEV